MKKSLKTPMIAGGLIAGAGLAYAASTLIRKVKSSDAARDAHVETSITIYRSPAALFAAWREFRNLPRFMKNLHSVVELDDRISHWIAYGPGGTLLEWDAELYNEKENELIAWRSVGDADVTNAGSVRFEEAPRGRGTYVHVTLNYNPPAGKLGKTLAQLFGAEPQQLIEEDLKRFKQLMEAGEIATIDGQPTGRDADAKPVENAMAAGTASA